MEIKNAFENSKRIPNTEMWEGTSSRGLKMQGFYKKPDGTGATAGLFMGKNNMLNNKIIFWWDNSSFLPTGGKLVKHPNSKKIFGFGAREIADWLRVDIQ